MNEQNLRFFRKGVRELLAATVIAEVAVAAAMIRMFPPSENTWRTFFSLRRGLFPAFAVTGVAVAIFHGLRSAKKPSVWVLAVLFADTFGLVAAAQAALAIAREASLSIAFISPWNTPLQFFWGITPFQVADILCVFILTPTIIFLMGFSIEWFASSLKRFLARRRVQACCDAIDTSSHETVGVGLKLKHRFSVAGAARHLKAQVKAAVSDCVRASCENSPQYNIHWHDSTDTVELEVLASSKDSGADASRRNKQLALDLADVLSRIDAEYVTDRAEGDKMFRDAN